MLSLEDIIGLETISADAKVIGIVEGVALDLAGWRIPAVQIGMKRGMESIVGRKKRLLSSEKLFLETSSIESISDAIILVYPASDTSRAMRDEEENPTLGSSMIGMRVISKNARYIGTVDNLSIDPANNWSIPNFQVKLNRDILEDLNMKKSFMNVPVVSIQASQVKAMGDMVILNSSYEDLRIQLGKSPSTANERSSPGNDRAITAATEETAQPMKKDEPLTL